LSQEHNENKEKKERMATDDNNSHLIRDGGVRTKKLIKSFTGNNNKTTITTNTNTNSSNKIRTKQDGMGSF
jgi:hypothetical protein